MKHKLLWKSTVLMIVLSLSIFGCASVKTVPDVGLQKIEAGHPAPGDGYFADEATVKELHKALLKLEELEAQAEKEPDQWQRFWTNMGALGAGVGIGLLVAP